MAIVMEMPKLSDTMREGTISAWLVAEGDEVKPGQVLVEIETDKAVQEWEAEEGGVLRKILVPAGESAPVGAPIAIIADPDEDIDDILAQVGSAAPGSARMEAAASGQAATPPPSDVPGAQAPPGSGGPPAAAPPAPTPPSASAAPQPAVRGEGGPSASPVAVRLALEAGIDLRSVRGTGPGGRIVKRDVLEAIARGGNLGGVAQAVPWDEAEPLVEEAAASQMRRAIAERLVASKRNAPHFYLTVHVDVEALAALRDQLNASGLEPRVSFNDLIVRAVALASTRVPAVNATWVEAAGGAPRIRRWRDVHVGVAVALDDGLVTPVVRYANRRGLRDIAREIRRLAQAARARKLPAEAYSGNTIAVSNLGMFGIDSFTAIINPPASVILAVGRIEPRPVVRDGAVVVRRQMNVTLSCDHRVVDGATGARWLDALRALLENPVEVLA